jgi:ParB-like chromosome segregation protein Spo0J
VAAAQEGSAGPAEGPRAPARPKAPYLRDLEEQLTRAVGTRVTILPSRARNTGRIVVEYYSLDDFDRIAAGLGLKAEG